MGEDDVPQKFIEIDRWGGQVMARLEDGWCAALDRDSMLCRIYARRPGVCREFEMGGDDCATERSRNSRRMRGRNARPTVSTMPTIKAP